MPEAETSKAVQLIDLLLKFFANERHWLRGGYHDGHGRRCLINAVHHLGNKHGLPCDPVMSALDEALPERRVGLVIFNDQRCRSIAELRALILKARATAIRNDDHERAAEALKRRLLREIEEERAAQSATGDDHSDRADERQLAPPAPKSIPGLQGYLAYRCDVQARTTEIATICPRADCIAQNRGETLAEVGESGHIICGVTTQRASRAETALAKLFRV